MERSGRCGSGISSTARPASRTRWSAQATVRASCSPSGRVPALRTTARTIRPIRSRSGIRRAWPKRRTRRRRRTSSSASSGGRTARAGCPSEPPRTPRGHASSPGLRRPASKTRAVAVTQDELYAGLDLELSWSERDLPEYVRTKHVHRLHPYHGKFIPQLVEVLLARYLTPGRHVLDPFAGSGTTAVQALESGLDATGVEVAAFNCLLMRVKTARYNPFRLERDLRDACARLESFEGADPETESRYLRAWYAPAALAELLFWRGLVSECEHADVLRV